MKLVQAIKIKTFVSTGIMTTDALVAKYFSKRGNKHKTNSSSYYKTNRWENFNKSCSGNKMYNTVENHSIIGGLRGALSEVLSENYPILIKRMGISDTFGESGSLNDLFCKYGLTAENIVKETKEIIKKKTNKVYNFCFK